MEEIIRSNRTLRGCLKSFGSTLSESGVRAPHDEPMFVLLCGANKSNTSKPEISARRRALIEFSKENLPRAQFFLAEDVFSTLQKEETKSNILDIETRLSSFADKIIIVLESVSSFTELGAFSHHELRNKLIVINDSKFRDSQSFVKMGPLKAIEDASGRNYVIQYRMNQDGVHRLDSIGAVYAPLSKLLQGAPRRTSSELSKEDFDLTRAC